MKAHQEISRRIVKQHKLGCKVAIVVNILWGIFNYFIIDENRWVYVGINLAAAVIIALALINRRKLKLKGEVLGLIPMLTTLTAFAYTYNTVELEVFQKMTYTHAAVFIGAGMFLLWHIKYSILSSIYAILINAVFFKLFCTIPMNEYLANGGMLIATVAIFMIVSIQVRYKLVLSGIASQIALEESKMNLRVSEEQHRLLFEKNPTPMLICSLETHKILAVNDLVISKYGYTRKEFMGMNITDLHKEIDYKDVILHTQNTLKEDSVSEWIHVLKDASEIDVELIAKSISYNEKSARLVSINDITEVNRYQDQLIASKQDAEKSKELQGQFLSNMSHEIRTPMNGIMGITRILQKSKLNKEQHHFLNAIIKSSENLMVIINDVLDFSKIEAGKVVIENTKFDLSETLDVVQEILVVKAEEKGIYLTVDMHENVPTFISGDSVRLNQVLINLVGNAIKFTEKGGVSIKVIATESTEERIKLRFDIRDTGIGIPSDKIDSIFQSFTQASSSTTRTHGGTGLGLTISKQLIELQNGKLAIESEEGKGSTFSFELEFDKVAQSEKSENELRIVGRSNDKILGDLSGIDILLVEDHPINQMLAIKVLEDWGFNVDLAENGLIALEKVGQKDYNLVLMDISMPEMDGYEATREIRSGKHCKNSDLPIVAMTASALIGENQKCYKAGMNDYITKPFDPQNLLEKIYNQVNNQLKSA